MKYIFSSKFNIFYSSISPILLSSFLCIYFKHCLIKTKTVTMLNSQVRNQLVSLKLNFIFKDSRISCHITPLALKIILIVSPLYFLFLACLSRDCTDKTTKKSEVTKQRQKVFCIQFALPYRKFSQTWRYSKWLRISLALKLCCLYLHLANTTTFFISKNSFY